MSTFVKYIIQYYMYTNCRILYFKMNYTTCPGGLSQCAGYSDTPVSYPLAWVSPSILLIPEFCPGEPRLSCGLTPSTNQMRPWD